MTGIILAGGENRRMGVDKAFLELGGKPLIEHILSVFSGMFSRTIIVTNSPDRYRAYGVDLEQDVLDVRGPLTGIYSGLRRSDDAQSFVAACDMPFLNARLIAYMREIAGPHDAVVPLVNGFPEPLHAIYSRKLMPMIGERVRSGDRRISRLFEMIDVRYVSEEEIERFDPQKRSFRNLNTPEEYKEAVCSDWECLN